jgi:hypothetical protein
LTLYAHAFLKKSLEKNFFLGCGALSVCSANVARPYGFDVISRKDNRRIVRG